MTENKDKKLGKRTPLYAQQNTGIKSRPGFVRRLVNELPGRVERFLNAGWVAVTDKDQDDRDNRLQNTDSLGTTYRPVVNRSFNSPCKHGIWMEIPEEFYNEDQMAKLQRTDEIEASYNPESQAKGDPNLYGANFKKS